MPRVEAPIEKWSGKVREVTLGGSGGRKGLTVGGEVTLPFLSFEGAMPHPPSVAIEVSDSYPSEWAESLRQAWGDVLKDPGAWAKRAAELGADLIVLRLNSAHPEQGNTGPEQAKAAAGKVLAAVDLPVIVLGPEVPEKDNEVLMAVSDLAAGQRIGLGYCMEKNYRTIAASCIANNHVALAKTPIDLNLAKQLNILISDVGLSADSIIMDPTTGALGYGLEYTYSVMERLRLAALVGDKMTAMPLFCTVGEESWRQKESKFAEGVPQTWGQHERRSLVWEQITALALINAGADIVVLRHPKTVDAVKAAIRKLAG